MCATTTANCLLGNLFCLALFCCLFSPILLIKMFLFSVCNAQKECIVPSSNTDDAKTSVPCRAPADCSEQVGGECYYQKALHSACNANSNFFGSDCGRARLGVQWCQGTQPQAANCAEVGLACRFMGLAGICSDAEQPKLKGMPEAAEYQPGRCKVFDTECQQDRQICVRSSAIGMCKAGKCVLAPAPTNQPPSTAPKQTPVTTEPKRIERFSFGACDSLDEKCEDGSVW